MVCSTRTIVAAWSLVVLLLVSASPGAAQERVTFSAKDGHPLAGTLMKPSGTPKGGVVLLPMAKSQRVAFDPLLPRLAKAGLTSLAFEPRYDEVEAENGESRPSDTSLGLNDLRAALARIVEAGAPVDKLAIVGAASGARLAIEHALATGVRIKALVLLSPGRDDPVPPADSLQALGSRPILVVATADEADKGARAIGEAVPGAQLQILEDRLAFGTGMFGRVTGIESTIADWIERALAQPSVIAIGASRLVIIDGEISTSEETGATKVSVPLGDGLEATVRLTHTDKRLDVGFDIPEPYVRLNEVVVYVAPSGSSGRIVDDACYRISYNPKNPARKPVIVQRGGLNGFTDSDDKGVIAFARTPGRERHWSAEVSLDRARFLPGDLPMPARLAFQINGQRLSDVRYYPDDAKVPTSPSTWADVRLE
jgi:hypothetical protein